MKMFLWIVLGFIVTGLAFWIVTMPGTPRNPLFMLLVVAIFTVHLPYGFSSIKLLSVTAAGAQFGPPGYEVNLLYLACLAALVLGGSGPLAIDGLITRRATARHS